MSLLPMDPNNPLFRILNPGMPQGGGIGGLFNRGPSWLQQGAQMGQRPGLRGLLSNPDLGLALLANSGPSAQPRSFGQILGQSALQAQQMGRDREDEEFKRKYMEAQMGAMGRQATERSPNGQYQPGDYTTQSWAKFLKDGDPAVLERYTTPRQEYTPSYRSVTRTRPDGSTELGSFDTRTNEYTWSGMIAPAGVKARVDAEGKAEGEAAGGQSGKAPAKSSFDYVVSQFREQLPKAPQGGVFGYKGKLGTVFDKADTERFDNLREQLSTELRTVFRIPGEGTLSDQEQKQYGIQLPSTNYENATNEQILNDVTERVRLRLETPVGNGASAAPAGGRKRRYNPATGKIE